MSYQNRTQENNPNDYTTIMIDPAIVQFETYQLPTQLQYYSAPPGINIPAQSNVQTNMHIPSMQSKLQPMQSTLQPMQSTFQNSPASYLQQPVPQQPLQQAQPAQPAPPAPPPTIQFNPVEYSMQLRRNLFETLKTVIYRNNGWIYGEFIINEIQCQYVSNEFYKQLQIMYPKDIYNMSPEYMQTAFNTPDVLPEFADRLNKYTNTIDIIIRKDDTSKLHTEIMNALGNNYKITVGNTKLLSTVYPEWAVECANLITYPVMFANDYMRESVTLYIVVNTEGDVTLGLPYGIYNFQEQYIMSDGKIYQLPESILASVQDVGQKQIILNDLIFKIQNKVSILMPYVIGDSEKIKKYLGFKNIIIDFIIKYNATEIINGDYYIINQHKGLTCTRCKNFIDSEQNCSILKCCNSPFHFQCLLECYINAEAHTKLKCTKCNTGNGGKLDLYGKNSDILMGILG